MEFPKKIADALHRERPFPLLKYAQEAWTLTNQYRSSFVGATFVFILFAIVAVFMASIVMALFGGSLKTTFLSLSAHPSGIQLFLNMVLMVGLLLLAIPIPAGYAQAAHTATTEGYIPFNDFFAGYERSKWVKLIATSLLQTLVTYGVVLILILIIGSSGLQLLRGNFADAGEFMALGMVMLAVLIVLAVRAIYMWSTHVTYFFDRGGWAALEASRKLVGSNFTSIILFDFVVIVGAWIVLVLIGLVLVLAGTLGIIIFLFFYIFALMVLISFFLNFQYVSFADRVGLNEEENDGQPNEDRIIDHFMPE